MGINKKTDENGAGRRKFLRYGLGFVAGIGIFSSLGNVTKAMSRKKIKMLTADGKLVEIDASKIEKVVKEKASNDEVQEWMKSHSK